MFGLPAILLTRKRAQYSADWGDYISFASRMREKADALKVDLLLVDTGDRVDGNGLYDASDPKGLYTSDIFKEQQMDVICSGNHELYKAEVAQREYTTTVPNFNGKYLASNLDIIDEETGEQKPLAQRYRTFTTKHQGIRVVAMGFLFNFKGGANNTIVQPVQDTIKEDWFQTAIREDADLFLIIGHVALRDPEFKAIYQAIRKQNWDTPIQFFGGHSHIRDYLKFDESSYALESGRYMETIGWMSIEGIRGKGGQDQSKEIAASTPLRFQRRYIDNNLYGYHFHTNLSESDFPTELGKNVSAYIHDARKKMNLDHVYGCAPKDLWLNRAKYPSNDSLITWMETEVLPDIISGNSHSGNGTIAIVNTGALRFDIFKGPFTRDTTYIVSPFTSGFKYIQGVPYSAAKRVLPLLNSGGQVFEAAGLSTSQLPGFVQALVRENVAAEEQVEQEVEHSVGVGGQIPLQAFDNKPQLIPGYTTKDDAGDEGDDTLHSPIQFYNVPNCVQAQVSFPDEGDPETVDLVFLEFIQPWVLLALKLSGHDYKADVKGYMADKSFTEMISGWIQENWESNC